MSSTWDTELGWRNFRLEAEAAEHYPKSYALYIGHSHRDQLLDRILPSLLQIKATTILDDAVEAWLEEKGHVVEKPRYKNDLNGRLCFLAAHGLVSNANEFHQRPDGVATRLRTNQTLSATGTQ